jgi:heme-degrading monooxygenase HmoA
MVLEVADIAVTPGAEPAFIEAYRQARGLLAAAEGVGPIRMTRGIESPSRFVLLVEWASIEAHQAFRASPAFGQWRALIGPHFAQRPHVEHVADL